MAKTKTAAQLWAAQLEFFPDSVELKASQVLKVCDAQTVQPTFKDPSDPAEWSVSMLVAQRDSARKRERAYRWLANALDTSKQGVFYACCRQEDGSYLYIGYRIGIEGSNYLSNFVEGPHTIPTI